MEQSGKASVLQFGLPLQEGTDAEALAQDFALSASVQDETVATIGDVEYTTLAAAIEAVEENGTIVLHRPVRENIEASQKTFTLDMNGNAVGAVEGSGKNVFTFTDSCNVSLKNGRIKGGDCSSSTSVDGKGIKAIDSSITLENCIIEENSGRKTNGSDGLSGGGIGIKGGSLTLVDTIVRNNEANSSGSAIYATASAKVVIKGSSKICDHVKLWTNSDYCVIYIGEGSTLEIDGAEISGNGRNSIVLKGAASARIANTRITDNVAPVLKVEGSTSEGEVVLEDTVVEGNSCSTDALVNVASNKTSFKAIRCSFANNSASWDKSSLIKMSGSAPKTIEKCDIRANELTDTGTLEGAPLRVESGPLDVKDSVFTGNKGYLSGAILNKAGSVTIADCTIRGNSGLTYGAAAQSGSGTMCFERCQITENEAIAETSNAAGALFVGTGTLSINDTVVKDNAASGSRASTVAGYVSGGICVTGGTFTMSGGALYNNESVSTDSNDFFKAFNGSVSVPAANSMADGSMSFEGYSWVDLSKTSYLSADASVGSPLPSTNNKGWTAVNVERAVAEIDGVQYKTLKEALQAVKDGQTVKLIKDDNAKQTRIKSDGIYRFGSGKSNSQTTYVNAKNITINLNGCDIYPSNLPGYNYKTTSVFQVFDGGSLTLKGPGTAGNTLYVNNGSLVVDGAVDLTESVGMAAGKMRYNYYIEGSKGSLSFKGVGAEVYCEQRGGEIVVGGDAALPHMYLATAGTSSASFATQGQIDSLELMEYGTGNFEASIAGTVEDLAVTNGNSKGAVKARTNLNATIKSLSLVMKDNSPLFTAGQNFKVTESLTLKPYIGNVTAVANPNVPATEAEKDKYTYPT